MNSTVMIFLGHLYPFLLAPNLGQPRPLLPAPPLRVGVDQLLVDVQNLAIADVCEELCIAHWNEGENAQECP